MRKFIILLTLAMLVLVAAPMAFAASENVTSITQIVFSSSKSVSVFYNANTAFFAAASKHTQGNRAFGATSDSTSFFYSTIAAGTDITASTVGGSTSAAFSSWTSL